MGTALDELKRLAPPPAHPVNASGSWAPFYGPEHVDALGDPFEVYSTAARANSTDYGACTCSEASSSSSDTSRPALS
jgi:hypothetical protein